MSNSNELEIRRNMVDHSVIHNNEKDFLLRHDRNKLRMTGVAAIAACERAAGHGLSIGRVEGGRWLNPGFEARMDAIWTANNKDNSKSGAIKNNHKAAKFISAQTRKSPNDASGAPDVFILFAARIEDN